MAGLNTGLAQNVGTLCVTISASPNQICVTFPGGRELCATLPTADFKTPVELAKALLDKVNTALAPLGPVFQIIDVVQAIGICVTAIQQFMVGDLNRFPPIPPLSPAAAAAFIACLPELMSKLEALLKLIPQLSFPLMLAQILDALILYFQGLRFQLQAMIASLTNLAQSITKASLTGNAQILLAIDCAKLNAQAMIGNWNGDAEPLNKLVSLYNLLIQQLINLGLPLEDAIIPQLDAMALSADANELADQITLLDDIIALLTDVRQFVFNFVQAAMQEFPDDFLPPQIQVFQR